MKKKGRTYIDIKEEEGIAPATQSRPAENYKLQTNR